MRFFARIPRHIRWIFSVMLLFLIVFTLYRLLFFFQYRGLQRPFSGSAFILGFRFDARFVSILGLGMLLLSSVPLLNPFRNSSAGAFWKVFLSLIFMVTLVVLGADFYHFDYLKQKLNASVLNFLQDAGISFNMMWQSYPLIKITLVLLLAVILFSFWHRKLLKRLNTENSDKPSKKWAISSYLFFVLLLAGFSFGKIGQFPLRWSDAFLFADDFKSNTALNPFQSFFSTLGKKTGYDRKKVQEYYPLMARQFGVKDLDSAMLNYERWHYPTDSFAVKPNIVLVICESFSAYKSNMYGNALNTTPYFQRLCDNGVFFDRCFTPAFGTARGVWATITGIPDVESPRTASRNPNAVNQHSIINDFKNYEPLYFLGGNPTWANIQGLLSNNINGLRIYAQDDFKAKKIDVWGISDKNLFLEANEVLKNKTTPFFAIIQTADNHRPFTIPEEDRAAFELVSFPEADLKRNGFESNEELNAFRYTDFCFKQFMEAAKKESYYNNTLFVFVGDHGIRGNAADLFPKCWTTQGLTCEHVPLLFYAPAFLKPQRIREVCSQVDILPSIASLARMPYRNNTFGRDLFDSSKRVGAKSSLQYSNYAFIIDHDLQTIGLVSDSFYFLRSLKTGKPEIFSVTDNAPVVATKYNDSISQYMHTLTDAWYETAKYLLLNNKKKN